MHPTELDEIEARCDAASPGPWKYPYRGFPGVVGSKRGCLWTSGRHEGRVNHEADAEFIAHARQDVPDLIAEIRRLRRHGAEK
jgi:hypothetical protein